MRFRTFCKGEQVGSAFISILDKRAKIQDEEEKVEEEIISLNNKLITLRQRCCRFEARSRDLFRRGDAADLSSDSNTLASCLDYTGCLLA